MLDYPKETSKKQTSPICGFFFIFCLLISVAGCVSVNQQTVSPIPLPDSFSASGKAIVGTQWWRAFDDSHLNGFIDTACNKNFTLLATRERIVQAQALARQAGASQSLSLMATGEFSSRRDYQNKLNTETFSFGLAASYEIDLWGRLKNKTDAAIFELEATKADYHSAQISLSSEVTLTWFKIIEARQQLELLQQQKETNQKVLQVITVQFRSGKTDISDVLQQRQLIESNTGALATLRANKRVLEHQFAILLGHPPKQTTTLYLGQLPKLPPLPQTGVPLALITRRPDVKSSFLTLQAVDQKAAAAVASRFPRLSLSANLSTTGDSAKDLFSDWFSTLAANLTRPIIDGGYLQAEVLRTESVARQQLNNYSQTILEAIVEVENALVREKELQHSLTSKEIQLQLAADTVTHVANRYRQGVENYQRVLLALISQQNLQRSILGSRLALLSNRIALYRALSGAIEER
ncbi:MAG: hypothetical protein COA36_09115 [Desulfotalea sp.]|nr:MAG: hypothetical protein COA36_09115 [Desulfotalea sp.]